MSERVLLVGRCRRKGHVLFTVVETDDDAALVIDAPHYAATRHWEDGWPARRRPLKRGSASAYGCACKAGPVVRDDDVLNRLARGDQKWVIG